MTVSKLLKQLEDDLSKAKMTLIACEQDFTEAFERHSSDQGTITYFYGRYEQCFSEYEKLKSAINIIKERVKE